MVWRKTYCRGTNCVRRCMRGGGRAVGVSSPWHNYSDYCTIKALVSLIKVFTMLAYLTATWYGAYILLMSRIMFLWPYASTMKMTTRSLSTPGNSIQGANEITPWAICMMVAHYSHRTVQVLQVPIIFLFIGILCNTPVLSIMLCHSETYFGSANTWSLYTTTADYQSSFSFEYIM